MNQQLKIKEFSTMVGLSKRTLQYYHEIGLLIPESIDDHGHRHYGSQNFSTVFVIQRLKEIGMSLKEIRACLSRPDFSLSAFVAREKERVNEELTGLHRRLAALTRIESYEQSSMFTNPAFSFLFTHEDITEAQLIRLGEKMPQQLAFNLKEAQQFTEELGYCQRHDLPAEAPRVKACLAYWREMLSLLGQDHALLTRISETSYQTQGNYYGMTPENYHYLQRMLLATET